MAVLADAATYFEAFASAVLGAKKTVYIAAWDINSRVELLRGNEQHGAPVRLGDFLNRKAAGTPGLRIYILCWDFAVIYAAEREWLPVFRLQWNTHRRIRFRMDGEHPIGASHHQKIVVVDDRVAFCGGIDLTKHRWDTPEHADEDPRRRDPDGRPYPPFHDVQALVEGDAAAAMGELFRERWFWASGKRLGPPRPTGDSPWPEGVQADVSHVGVGISRTFPAYKGRPEIKEVEALYLDGIAVATRWVYMENQYLTSAAVSLAIRESLARQDGPEIILVIPRETDGWLAQSTMDAMRNRIVSELRQSDPHRRLRLLYPSIGKEQGTVFVHAKVMIVDDRLVRVGSANLSNRSMGLDSECDLAVEAESGTRAAAAIDRLRCGLLAEHLGSTPEEVSDATAVENSLIRMIESMNLSQRRLIELKPGGVGLDLASIIRDDTLLDPEKPVLLDEMIDRFHKDGADLAENGKRRLIRLAGLLAFFLFLAAVWRWTRLGDWLTVESLAGLALTIKDSPLAGIGVAAAYAAGGLLMVPVTLMVAATAVVFPAAWAVPYALGGCLSNAALTYTVGAWLGREAIRSLAGRRINRLSRRLATRGVLSVAIARNLPIAPFAVVNMVAGASHIRLKDFLLGTLLGMAPGVCALVLFTDRLLHAVREPNWLNISMGALFALILVGIAWWIGRLARKAGST